MSQPSIFDSETPLPSDSLAKREKNLLGFETRYARVHDQLRLLLNVGALGEWNRKHHGGKLALCDLVSEQYPLAIFHGDVGTGKTAMAECIANRLVAEARSSDSILFKLSNRVRGNGMVGEMGTLIAEAFRKVILSAGKTRRAILIIDEADSLGTRPPEPARQPLLRDGRKIEHGRYQSDPDRKGRPQIHRSTTAR